DRALRLLRAHPRRTRVLPVLDRAVRRGMDEEVGGTGGTDDHGRAAVVNNVTIPDQRVTDQLAPDIESSMAGWVVRAGKVGIVVAVEAGVRVGILDRLAVVVEGVDVGAVAVDSTLPEGEQLDVTVLEQGVAGPQLVTVDDGVSGEPPIQIRVGA